MLTLHKQLSTLLTQIVLSRVKCLKLFLRKNTVDNNYEFYQGFMDNLVKSAKALVLHEIDWSRTCVLNYWFRLLFYLIFKYKILFENERLRLQLQISKKKTHYSILTIG